MQSNNESIKDSLRKIMQVNGNSPSFTSGCVLINGFVKAVYPDNNTVDVIGMENETMILGASLSALEGSKKGNIRLPIVNSEVCVLLSGEDSQAYVVCTTHLTDQLIEVSESAYIGATGETEQNDNTDYDEVAETGYKTYTKYTPEEIQAIAEYQGEASKITQVYQKITHEVGNASMEMEDGTMKHSVNGSYTLIENNKITHLSNKVVLGQESSAQPTPLGTNLQNFLTQFLTQVSNILTTTMAGPMPILNKAQVEALRAPLAQILSNVVSNQ